MADDLTAFITTQLDEDQAFATSAASDVKRLAGRANWSAELAPIVIDAEDPEWAIADLSPFVDDEHLARHIARHDPARVLREVEAKRAILALHHPEYTEYVDADGDDRSSVDCAEDGAPGTPDSWPCPTIRHVAAVWSDRPDYRPEWKP